MTAVDCNTCRKCGEVKPISAFSVIKKTGKPNPYCKACRAALASAYAVKNRDAKKVYNAEYREKNIEHLRAYDAERRKDPKRKEAKKGGSTRARNKNLEKYRERERKYRAENIEKLRAAERARYIPVPRKTSYTETGKVCAKCGTDKPLSEFYERADQPGKHRAYCKACERDKRALKGDYNREKSKTWREANPDSKSSDLDRLREWGKNNPERRAEHSRVSCRNRQARKRKAGGTHTAADIKRIHDLQRGCCAACFKPLKGKYHVDHRVALARGGSNDWTNLQLLHAMCNLRKHARDPAEYMQEEHGLLL